MKAVHIVAHGEIDQVRYGDIPDPVHAHDEVVLDVVSAALNHLDIWVRKGRPGLSLNFPHVLGSDCMGVVVEVGQVVRREWIGSRVVINPGVSCGACEYCRRGEQSECPRFTIMGLGRQGVFAQRVSVPAVSLCPAPEHLTPHEAAALPLAYLTAWRMLFTRGNLRPGETVLIHGIGGGVAIAGLQLGKLAGAEVIVTSSKTSKLQRARDLGADHTINYADTPDVASAVKDLTQGRGVDLVLDTTGAATWPINFAAVRRGGRIVHCGVTTGKTAEVDISALYWNHITVMGSTMGSNEEFRAMVRAVSAARLRPVVDSVYPLRDAKAAMGKMEKGEQFGKIVLEV